MPSAVLHPIPRRELAPGIQRQFLTTDRMTIARFTLARGAAVPPHSHNHEQVSYVVSGALKFHVADHGYNDAHYRECAACKSRDLTDSRQMFQNLNNGFPVTPGITYFGNNTSAMRRYFGVMLNLNQISVPCTSLVFYGR